VHFSEQAVAPPGDARSDMAIFLDYAERMGFRDKDGAPQLPWSTSEEVFEAWKACSKGRPCDYSGLSYDKLRGGSGIPWPCTEDAPDGTERLYVDGRFHTDAEYCEDYGHDLVTGAANDESDYRALNPAGRAILKAAHYRAPHEPPRDEYPFSLTTGRTVYHFHTRTKTGRSPQLDAAAPDAWVELAPPDARRLGVEEGDRVAIESPRGRIEVAARLTGIKEGVAFVPFHYGYWDADTSGPNRRPRAANELTVTKWDPVSKQPLYKVAAVHIEKKVKGRRPLRARRRPHPRRPDEPPRNRDSALPRCRGGAGEDVRRRRRATRRRARRLPSLHDARRAVGGACGPAASDRPAYGGPEEGTSATVARPAPVETEPGPRLLADLSRLFVLAQECWIDGTVVRQAALAKRDKELISTISTCLEETSTQVKWLQTRIKTTAPQALTIE
jgi:ferredoxin-nitrate reductase